MSVCSFASLLTVSRLYMFASGITDGFADEAGLFVGFFGQFESQLACSVGVVSI